MASFLKAARRSPATDADAGADEVAVAPPPVATWAPALLDTVAPLTGSAPAFADEPVALPHGYGPWAFAFRLDRGLAAGTDGDATAGLALRLATDRAELEREVAAMALNQAHGLAVPAVRGIVPLTVDGGTAAPADLTADLRADVAIDIAGDGSATIGGTDRARWALVTDAVGAIPLPELIGFNLHHANELLDGFAAHHDAIHRLPIDELRAAGVVPTVSPRDELDRIDRTAYPAEWAWLDEHVPAPAEPVLCHGGYQPLAVFGPPADEWPDHGGPGHGLTVVNWCGAVLAEPELDMAFTLVAFWSAPFFAPNRSERTAIKMIRNTLLNTYKQGYTARREVDLDRLRFWQAFHSLRGLARLAGAYDPDGSPFAAGDRGAVPVDLGPELHRHFRQLTRVR